MPPFSSRRMRPPPGLPLSRTSPSLDRRHFEQKRFKKVHRTAGLVKCRIFWHYSSSVDSGGPGSAHLFSLRSQSSRSATTTTMVSPHLEPPSRPPSPDDGDESEEEEEEAAKKVKKDQDMELLGRLNAAFFYRHTAHRRRQLYPQVQVRQSLHPQARGRNAPLGLPSSCTPPPGPLALARLLEDDKEE